MTSAIENFDEWFGDAPAHVESTGGLVELRAALAPLGIEWLFLIDDGRVIAAEPIAVETSAAWDLEAVSAAWQAIHPRASGAWHPLEPTSGAALWCPLPESASRVLCLTTQDAPTADAGPHLAVIASVGVCLQAIGRLQMQNREFAARVKQLEAERECLRESHNAATAEAIEEHESRLRERSQYAQSLEAEVERRSRDLMLARQAAESANHAKSQFLANMSHEIRTPMTAILGYTDILIDEHAGDDAIMHWLNVIKRNGHHLLEIINDILDLSKIESGQLIVESVQCSPFELARDIQALMQGRAEQKQVPLRLEARGALPERILSDPTRLRQILINLVGNAIKFTSRGAVTIVVSCQRNEQGGYQLQFAVRDSGIGITPEQLGRLFTPFSQADASTTRTYGGTGLGLAISRRLAHMLGGEIAVESTAGVGSTFTLTIPCGDLVGVGWIDPAESPNEASRALAVDDIERHALSGCRVLLAEDGLDNQRFIAYVLRGAGADVETASNGLEAVQAVRERSGTPAAFHVVLMDMQMPELDGYGAVRELRATGERVPIIALTAHAMSGDRQKCLDAGCDDYDNKPIDRRRLLEKVAAAWRRGAAESSVTEDVHAAPMPIH